MKNLLAGKKRNGWAVIFTAKDPNTEAAYLTFWGRPYAQSSQNARLPHRVSVSPYLFDSPEEARKSFKRIPNSYIQLVNLVWISLPENQEEQDIYEEDTAEMIPRVKWTKTRCKSCGLVFDARSLENNPFIVCPRCETLQ